MDTNPREAIVPEGQAIVAQRFNACHYPDLFHACLSYPDLQPIAQRCLALARLSVPHRLVYEYNNSAATWSVGPE